MCFVTCEHRRHKELGQENDCQPARHLWCAVCRVLGNHEEESEIVFGDDITHITGCSFPGVDGKTPDCARAFVYAPLRLALCTQ